MGYRDEREALQNQVQKLEVDLEEAKRNAAGDEVLRARSEKLEGEIAALRRERRSARSRAPRAAAAPRPAPGKAGSGLAVIAIGAAAVLGLLFAAGVVTVLLRRPEPAPEPREIAVPPAPVAPVPTAQVVEYPSTTPPEAIAPGTPPEATKPPSSAVHEGKARWAATVKRAEGMSIAKGSTCFIDATLHTIGTNEEWPELVVTCGAQKVYDSSDSLNGMAMTSADPLERFAKADGQSVFTLKYEDKGTRGSSKNQIMLDTTKGLGVIWSENLPTFRIELAVPVESAPAPPVAERLSRKGTVTATTGAAPAKAGEHCSVRAFGNGHHATCIADVSCDGRSLVKPTDDIACTYESDRPSAISRKVDDLAVTVDADTAKITVPGDKGYTIEIALDEP